MPNLPTRKVREEEMAAALWLLFQAWESQTDLQPGDFVDLAEEVAAAVTPSLAAAHAEAAAQLAAIQGFVTSDDEIQRNSQDWAEGHGLALGQLVANTTELGLLQGKSPAELFSRQRAVGIAITETTRAITVGEALILVLLLDETGKRLIAIWYTRPEATKTGPCPVCRPLHGTRPEVWRLVAPAGPPVHPLCVCELRYEVA